MCWTHPGLPPEASSSTRGGCGGSCGCGGACGCGAQASGAKGCPKTAEDSPCSSCEFNDLATPSLLDASTRQPEIGTPGDVEPGGGGGGVGPGGGGNMPPWIPQPPYVWELMWPPGYPVNMTGGGPPGGGGVSYKCGIRLYAISGHPYTYRKRKHKPGKLPASEPDPEDMTLEEDEHFGPIGSVQRHEGRTSAFNVDWASYGLYKLGIFGSKGPTAEDYAGSHSNPDTIHVYGFIGFCLGGWMRVDFVPEWDPSGTSGGHTPRNQGVPMDLRVRQGVSPFDNDHFPDFPTKNQQKDLIPDSGIIYVGGRGSSLRMRLSPSRMDAGAVWGPTDKGAVQAKNGGKFQGKLLYDETLDCPTITMFGTTIVVHDPCLVLGIAVQAGLIAVNDENNRHTGHATGGRGDVGTAGPLIRSFRRGSPAFDRFTISNGFVGKGFQLGGRL